MLRRCLRPTPRVDSTMTDEDDGRCRSPVAASPGRLEHPAPPMYQRPRRGGIPSPLPTCLRPVLIDLNHMYNMYI